MLRLCLAASLAASLSSIAPTQTPYGSGSPGTNGVSPELRSTRPFVGDSNFGLDVSRSAPNLPGAVLLSLQPFSFPLLGIEILVDPTALLVSLPFVLPASVPTETTVPLPIPATNVGPLIGLPLYAQALIIDSAGSSGFSASRGLQFAVQRPPQIFVAASILSRDPFQLLDPATNTVVDSGTPIQVDNADGAAFASGGNRLFVASSIRGTISVGDTTSTPTVWTTLYTAPNNGAHGLEYDPINELVWTLAEQTSGSSDLAAIDVDPVSPTFGSALFMTAGPVATPTTDFWTMSKDRTLAALVDFANSTITVVDTDRNSPTFLQTIINNLPIPNAELTPGLRFASAVCITPDNQQVLVSIRTSAGEIASLNIPSQTWLDFNPMMAGQQNLGVLSQPQFLADGAMQSIEINRSGTFAIVAGIESCGFVGRIDLDPNDPLSLTYVPFNPGVPMTNSFNTALSGDETEFAVSIWPPHPTTNPMPSCPIAAGPAILRIDSSTGTLLGSIPIPSNSNGVGSQNLSCLEYR